MRISAKADYAVRAVIELAAAGDGEPVKAEHISAVQGIPLKFLQNILVELKQAGLVRSFRGAEGGSVLARDPASITVADVIRVTDGPLARVGNHRPEELSYPGQTAALRDVWVAVRVSLRDVLEEVTVADICRGSLPSSVVELLAQPGAWQTRGLESESLPDEPSRHPA